MRARELAASACCESLVRSRGGARRDNRGWNGHDAGADPPIHASTNAKHVELTDGA